MNKKITAGVAALAFAAAPVARAIAVDCSGSSGGQLQDSITLNVNNSCTFSRTSGNGSVSLSMDWNALDYSKSETFSVSCNDAAGWKVTGTFSNMTGTANQGSTYKTTINYATAMPTAGSGTWTAIKGEYAPSGVTGITSGSSGNVINKGSSSTGQTATTQKITYVIGTRDRQERGTYTATATYVAVSNT